MRPMKNRRTASASVLKTSVFLVTFVAVISLSALAYSKIKILIEEFPQLPAPQIQKAKPEPERAEKRYAVEVYQVTGKAFRDTTAYTPGDRKQTDATPCISADGTDICKELVKGEKVCAANFVPLGTKLYIEGFGICTVKDRLHKRYKNRVDLAMKIREKDHAIKWGKKSSKVEILK